MKNFGEKFKGVRVLLKTSFDGLKLENPLMPASGPLVGDYDKMMFIQSMGVGAIVTKTVSSVGADVPRPCIVGGKDYIMNCELWSEYGPEKWTDEFLPKLKRDSKVPVIISAGYVIEDMERLIPQLDQYADAFEISTHYVGKDGKSVGDVVRAIRKHTKKPVYMKLSPNTPDPLEFTRAAIEAGANGIVAINSLGPTLSIDIDNRRIKCGGEGGFVWTSGPVIKNLSLALIYMLRKEFEDITIIGTGGVKTADDVIEFLLAGADGVQMLSSAMLYGKTLYRKIIEDLPKALDKHGFKSVEEVRNTSLKHKVYYEKDEIRYPKVIKNKCVECGKCQDNCPYFAITMAPFPQFDWSKCFSCGLCQSKCPTNAIYGVLGERDVII